MTDIGSFGFALDIRADGEHLDDAAAIEQLGYSTLWIAGGQLGRPAVVTELLAATTTAVIATAVLSSEVHDAATIAALHTDAQHRFPDRLVVGLGGPQTGLTLGTVANLLDGLDAARPPVPVAQRMLAALGPRKLELAATRTAGAITLLVTPEYLRHARTVTGNATLAVDLPVVLDNDPHRARAVARPMLQFLGALPGYQAHLHRLGFTDPEIAAGADRLIDAVTAWGDPARIADRVAEFRAAGADHVYVSLLGGAGQPTGVAAARLLAPMILPSGGSAGGPRNRSSSLCALLHGRRGSIEVIGR